MLTSENKNSAHWQVSDAHAICELRETLENRKFIDQTKLPGRLQSPMPKPDFFFDFSKESGIKKHHAKTLTQKNPQLIK